MTALRDTLSAFRQAHELIWRSGMWKYLAVPVVLTVLYLPVVVIAAFLLAGVSADAIAGILDGLLGEPPGWLLTTVHAVFMVLYALLGFVTYRTVVLLFYAPFLDKIGEQVEARLIGSVPEDDRPWTAAIGRVVLMILLVVGLSIVLFLVNLVVSSLPFIGWLLSLCIVLPVQFFLLGTGYIDPVLDRHGCGVGKSFRLMRRKGVTVTVFAIIGSVLLLIPLVGWFLGPTYSVVAGVILGHEMLAADRPDRGLASPSQAESPAGPQD